MFPRKTTLTSLGLVPLAATAANAWDVVVYGDGKCETTPTAAFSGNGNQGIYPPHSRRIGRLVGPPTSWLELPRRGCTRVPDPHRAFETSYLGNRYIYLYANKRDCQSGDYHFFYDEQFDDLCISPDYLWDYFRIEACWGLLYRYWICYTVITYLFFVLCLLKTPHSRGQIPLSLPQLRKVQTGCP